MKKTLKALLCLMMSVLVMIPAMGGFAANYDPPVVEVEEGQLRGFQDGSTYIFRGVQYATAGRWEQPQAVAPWEGVRDAQTYGAISPIQPHTAMSPTQVNRDEFVWPHRYWIQDEECMNLNIWTQSLDASAKKPVMVFFHGGGFNNGSSIEAYAYDGKNLSEFGDVVTVSVNHRLNVLGCLDLSAYGEEYKNSGNIAMADLVAALKWIQANIETFGGDPDRVMIFGQSGGSTKTALMYYIPEAADLFAYGAGHSSGGASTMEPGDSALVAAAIMEHYGFDDVDDLIAVPYSDLVEVAYDAIDKVSEDTGRAIRFRPTKDGEFILDDWDEGSIDKPYIIGTVFSENAGTLHKGTGKNEWTDDEVQANLTEAYGDDADAIAEAFLALYPEKKAQDVLYYNNRQTVTTNTLARTEASDAPVYQYLFSYEAPVNGGITAFHCAELTYVFHNVDMPECKIATGGEAGAYAVQDAMAQAWVNFAYTGDPSIDGIEWKPWNDSDYGAMIFDEETRFASLDDVALCEMLAAH